MYLLPSHSMPFMATSQLKTNNMKGLQHGKLNTRSREFQTTFRLQVLILNSDLRLDQILRSSAHICLFNVARIKFQFERFTIPNRTTCTKNNKHIMTCMDNKTKMSLDTGIVPTNTSNTSLVLHWVTSVLSSILFTKDRGRRAVTSTWTEL